MSGSKFSTSRGRVIYVGDFLREFGPDALRYFIAVAGPETTDTDFTWDEFVRLNFELANGWGNLVNRSISMACKNNAAIPSQGSALAIDADLLATSRAAFGTVGELLGRNRFRRGHLRGDAHRGGGEQIHLRHRTVEARRRSRSPRHRTAHRAAGRLRCEHFAHAVPRMRRRCTRRWEAPGVWAAQPEVREGDRGGGAGLPVIMGDYAAEQATWESPTHPTRHTAQQADATVCQAGRDVGPTGPSWSPIDS